MAESDSRRVVGVFAKLPLPGQVKTRIAASASPQFAARLAEAMLRDTLQRLSAIPANRVLAFTPAHALAAFEEFARGDYSLSPQSLGNLGERMSHFFREQSAEAECVVLVGTDSPSLPREFIERAFDALRQADVVLGPASDGGFYLIGCRRPVPEAIFQGVDWGECTVLGQTVARLPAECRLELLPPWYDIDTLQDLDVLSGHVAALRRAGVEPGLPHLAGLLGW
jgi:uncharacterized protein